MTAPAARRRDRNGDTYYPVPDQNGEIVDLPSWSRLKNLLYSYPLEQWKLKGVASQIAAREDLQMLAGDEDNVKDAVRQALDGFQAKANTGTAAHKLVELDGLGVLTDDQIIPAARPWIDNYRRTRDLLGLRVVEAEATVVNLTFGYAGTADQFVEVTGAAGRDALAAAGVDPDGVFCSDTKTGGVWPEVALQLCAYSHGEFIWVPPSDDQLTAWVEAKQKLETDIAAGINPPPTASGRARKEWNKAAKDEAYAALDALYWSEFGKWPGRRPMPDGLRTDVGLVVNLKEDRCPVIPVRLDGKPSALDVVGALVWVFKWQQRNDIIGKELTLDADSRTGLDGGDVVSGDVGVKPEAGDPQSEADAPTDAPSSEPAAAEAEAEAGDSDRPREGGHVATAGDAKRARKEARAALERPGTAENHAVPGEYRFAWLRTRLQAIIDAGRGPEVATRWPVGTPTLKTFGHDDAGLDRITELLTRVEADHSIPFGPGLRTFVPLSDEFCVDLEDQVGYPVEKIVEAFPGSTEIATDDTKKPYINWLRQIVERDPAAGDRITADLDTVGLRKSLSRDQWTPDELKQLDGILRRAERAALTAQGAQQQQHTQLIAS